MTARDSESRDGSTPVIWGSVGNLDHRLWEFPDERSLMEYKAAESELREVLVRHRANLGDAPVHARPEPAELRGIARAIDSSPLDPQSGQPHDSSTKKRGTSWP